MHLCIYIFVYVSLWVCCVLSVSGDTFSFPVLFKENPSDSNAKYVSYDVKSKFNSIFLGEAVDLVLDKIYVWKKLQPY